MGGEVTCEVIKSNCFSLAAVCSKPSVPVLFSSDFKSCSFLDPLEGHCCVVNT